MQAGPRNAFFVDVGANIGAFTFLMAARGYDVYAFVPQQCNELRTRCWRGVGAFLRTARLAL
jgi:hypothetical protein